MKRLFATILIILLPALSFATPYYVKSGGNDTLDGLTDATAWETIAKLNTVTFNAGDTPSLCKGDEWIGKYTVLGNGTSGNPITLTSYDCGHGSAQPVINANGANNQAIHVQAKAYWVIDGIHVKNGLVGNIQFTAATGGTVRNSTSTGGVIGINVISTSSGVTVTGNTINQSATGSAIAIASTVTGTNTISNNTINGTAAASTARGIDLQCATAVVTGNTATGWQGTGTNRVFSAVSVSSLTMSNNLVSNSREGFDYYLESVTAPQLTNNISRSSAGQGLYLKTCSNANIDRMTVTDSVSTGITTTGLTGANVFISPSVDGASSGISLFNTPATLYDAAIRDTTANGLYIFGTSAVTTWRADVYNAGADAIRAQGSATVSNYDCRVDYSGSDGLSTAETASMTDRYCNSTRNGWTDTLEAGDGATAHDTSTHNVYSSLLANNRKSGAMMVGASHGEIIGNTIYNNYDATNVDDYGIAIQSTATYTVRNNVTMAHRTELYYSPGTLVSSDYNCTYDSRGGSAYYWNGAAYTWANYLTASGQDSHSVHADPKMVNAPLGKYYLRYDSPCINTAADLGDAYRMGLDKLSVWPLAVLNYYQDRLWDMGAYPYRATGASW